MSLPDDIEPMTRRSYPGDKPAVPKRRLVGGSEIWVVTDDHIAMVDSRILRAEPTLRIG